MTRSVTSRGALLTLGLLISGGGLAGLCGSLSCNGTNPTPGAVVGPAVAGNVAPTLTILEPTEDKSVGQDETVPIGWSDSDRDSAARISFSLVDTLNAGVVIPLVTNLEENDTGPNGLPTPETFDASMSVVPPGSYFIQGTIRDGINAPVVTYATTELSDTTRVVLTVTQPGFQPPSQPPVIVVTTPSFNLSVSQDDELAISVQPTLNDPAIEFPYDGDSEAILYILLDVDEDPTNDNPAFPDPDQIIVLREQTLTEGEFDAIDHTESVDLATVPLRPDGRPYFVRATVQDPTNEPVHAYAAGTISVAQAASGTVDLGQIGRTLLGVTFRGFNPGSNLGSRMISARDFDADGVDDMLLVARFGNPRNFGNIGEAYLIYGLNQQRFGGAINVNSTSSTVPGVILEAPPVRLATGLLELFSPCGSPHTFTNPRTEGITDVAMIGDLSGDGRPEILVGMPHVDGIFQARDDDPGDDPPAFDDTIDIQVVIRQGSSELTIGDDIVFTGSFLSFEDTVIDSEFPNSNFGGSQDLEWDNDGPGEKKWTLIRIRDLLTEIPDGARNIDDLSATLTLRVVNEGENGSVHECFTPFTESSVTFANFAEGGGEPQEGDGLPGNGFDGVDYDEEELGDLSGDSVGTTDVDITDLVQRLIDGELESVGNDLLLIVVPDDDGEDNTRLRSSEFGSVPDDRPTLTITYQRQGFTGACGCYPDFLANNWSTPPEVDEDDEAGGIGIEALGFVSLVHSENRDNEGPNINLDRLESTTVALELVGQQAFLVDLGGFGPITQRAQADLEGRINGARFQVGMYDWVDVLELDQPPLEASFGWNVASMPDMDADGLDEIIISAPTNERDVRDLEEGPFFPFATHLTSRVFFGSIIVLTGADYSDDFWWDKSEEEEGCGSIPITDHFRFEPATCSITDPEPRVQFLPFDRFEIFAEDIDDFLGGGRHAGDFNLDGVPDILAGAPFNDSPFGEDTGVTYVIYGRVPVGDYDLSLADDPTQRPPLVRIRGETPGDRIGTRQELVGDINGDRIPDIAVASPWADFGGVARPNCIGDFDCDGDGDNADLNAASFDGCLGQEVFSEAECEPGDCKVFDYDNDRTITEADRVVFECLQDEGENCCPVDNGYVGVIFGGVTLDGDRVMSQVATSDLPGVIFYGTAAGDRAGTDVAAAAEVASSGDFNQDGFDDLLIVASGEIRVAATGEEHLGVVYLIFGGPHLNGGVFPLSLVGTDELPGIVFLSPYARGRPNEAPPDHVGFLGDINGDGFADIAIGNTRADFVDETLPQEPGGPGTDPGTGRRPDSGDIYVVYGNNFGSNR